MYGLKLFNSAIKRLVSKERISGWDIQCIAWGKIEDPFEAGTSLQVLLRVDLVAAMVHSVHVQKVGRFSAPACFGAHVQEVADPLPHPSSWFKKLVTW